MVQQKGIAGNNLLDEAPRFVAAASGPLVIKTIPSASKNWKDLKEPPWQWPASWPATSS
jgi:hypothetical protein